MHVSYVSHHALSELSCTSLTVVPYWTGMIIPIMFLPYNLTAVTSGQLVTSGRRIWALQFP